MVHRKRKIKPGPSRVYCIIFILSLSPSVGAEGDFFAPGRAVRSTPQRRRCPTAALLKPLRRFAGYLLPSLAQVRGSIYLLK